MIEEVLAGGAVAAFGVGGGNAAFVAPEDMGEFPGEFGLVGGLGEVLEEEARGAAAGKGDDETAVFLNGLTGNLRPEFGGRLGEGLGVGKDL